MTNTHIHIDRIHINGQGIPPQSAQSAVQGLGQDLLARLGPQNWSSGQTAPIGDLHLGTVQVKNPQDVSELRQAIAQTVIQAIVSQTGVRR
jgi:hypothetical protein